MKSQRIITYAEAIAEGTRQLLESDKRVMVIGEGVPDPKHIFGTTAGLEAYPGRVLDMPVSENGMTGIIIGASLRGFRPILTHQRVDFSLLSMDQIVNTAAKWHYMFGDQQTVPIIIRMVIGRGWGQGAQHSQSLQALFAHIPGLTVVMPTTAYDAKGMLIAASRQDNPVIWIEHRWLHALTDAVPEDMYEVPLNTARIMREGNDVTIVSSSYSTIEAFTAAEKCKDIGLSVGVVDMRSIRPLDLQTILKAVRKTKRLVIADTGWTQFGVSAEVIAAVVESGIMLAAPPIRVALPDTSIPSSPRLAKNVYPTEKTIASAVLTTLGKDSSIADRLFPDDPRRLHDVPNPSFRGPF